MTRFVDGLQQGKAPELAMQAAQLETIKNYRGRPEDVGELHDHRQAID